MDNTNNKIQEIQEIIDLYRARVDDPSIHVYPTIPQDKLNNAIKRYAPNVLEADVLVLVDDTVRKNAHDGGIITKSRFYTKNIMEKPKSMDLMNVGSVSFSDRLTTKGLFVDGKLFLNMSQTNKDVLPYFAEMVDGICKYVQEKQFSSALLSDVQEEVVAYVEYSKPFEIELVKPRRSLSNTQSYQPSEILQSVCQLFEDYLLINIMQYGKTKYLSYLFGGIGAFVLSPIFGSLSPGYKSFRIPWKQIDNIQYFENENVIDIHCLPDQESKRFLFSFQGKEKEKLLENLSAFCSVQGYTPQQELSRTFTDNALCRETEIRIRLIAKWVKKKNTLPDKSIIAGLANDLGVDESRISKSLHHLYEHNEEVKKSINQYGIPNLITMALVDELSHLDYASSSSFCKLLTELMLGELRKEPQRAKVTLYVLATLVLVIAVAMLWFEASFQGWLIYGIILIGVALVFRYYRIDAQRKIKHLENILQQLAQANGG